MRKPKVITNYRKEKQAALSNLAKAMRLALAGNADFPAPPVLMPAFLLLITDYDTKLSAAEHGTPAQTAAKNVSKEILLNAISDNGVYINVTAAGNEVMLQGSGYTMAKVPQPKGPLEVPAQFTVAASREPGRVSVNFSALPGAAYIVRLTPTPDTDRVLWPTTVETRRSFIIEGLTSGTRYTAIGAYKGASNLLNFTAPVEVVVQ